MDSVAWGALTLTLTALGAVYTVWAFRSHGVVSGLRGLGLTLVPLGLLLTSSLRMVTRVVDAVGDWIGGLAWNPMTWVGLIVLGLAVTCFVVAGVIRGRQVPAPRGSRASRRETPGRVGSADSRGSAALPSSAPRGRGPVVDDDMAEIEALLRKRGIQ